MENVNCIDDPSVELVSNTKGSLQYMLIGAVCGILLLGIILTQKRSTADMDYSQIINAQRAQQALAMRTDLSY